MDPTTKDMQDSYATTPTHTKHIKFKFIRNVSTVADQKVNDQKVTRFWKILIILEKYGKNLFE